MNCSYNPKHTSIESHLDPLSKSIDSLSFKTDNFVLLSDFNSCMEDILMKTFGENYKLQNLIKEPRKCYSRTLDKIATAYTAVLIEVN